MKKASSIPGKLTRSSVKVQRPRFGTSVTDHSREAWSAVLGRIHQARNQLDVRGNEDCWYRGQSVTHTLCPSLYRLLNHGFNETDGDPRSIYELEYDLYFEFACRGPGMQDPGFSGWDKLAHMRHHGLPTRLLDWTERLGVAIFFALSCWKGDVSPEPAIWLLSPCALNEEVLGDRDLYSPDYLGYDWNNDERWDYEDYLIFEGGTFDWDGPVAIYPAQKSQRMRSQMGWFTIFGEETKPLEQQFPPSKFPNLIQKVELPVAAIPAAREFLTEAGVDEATIYPDLDGFADYLKSHYGIPQ